MGVVCVHALAPLDLNGISKCIYHNNRNKKQPICYVIAIVSSNINMSIVLDGDETSVNNTNQEQELTFIECLKLRNNNETYHLVMPD